MKEYLKIFILPLFVLISVSVASQRQIKSFNDGWQFSKGEKMENERTMSSDNSWKTVSIPHTWNTDAYISKDYYRGVSWYRKSFSLSKEEKDKNLFLRFEGVNQSATVYINGKLVGEHKGGYTSFTFDISGFCNREGNNLLTVKVDNSLADIPPISGDFSIFGGIYRDVWLVSVPQQHFDLSDNGSDGIYIDTDNVSEKSGSYTVKSTVVNNAPNKATIKVSYTVVDINRNIVKTEDIKYSLTPGQKKTFSNTYIIEQPLLWSPETPNLYTVEAVIKEASTNKILDIVRSPLGFRWFSFDGQKGFSLNGKPYKLRGICRHQDQMPLGNALTDEAHRRDMQLIKDMGANFIRISHYPQDKAIIEQCDKLGLLVWEEIPVIDIIPEEESFGDNCETALREMIRQHYNHPSIIMWGYMNEILLVTQRKHKGLELDALVKRELALARRLENVLKEEDSRRYSVMAFHGSETYNQAGFQDIVDVVGWNLYQGWYSDNLSQFDAFIKKQASDYPKKPKIISEYGAGSDRRIHSLQPQRFDFSIEYQQEYIEHYLPVIEREPYIAGATYWNFIDFGSAQRDESMPRINNKGLVYADRTPKDVYYYFKANFRQDIPVLHIASYDWDKRTGISANGTDVIQPIKVYSNLSEVELFIDDRSLGIKGINNYNAVWNVPFTDGDHYIEAKGVYKGVEQRTGLPISFTVIPEYLNRKNFSNKELAINIGNNASYTSPETGLTWIPDKPYTEGSWGYIGGKVETTLTQINGTNDNPLYQTMRMTPDKYKFDVPDGEYEVELLFADISGTGASIAHTLGTTDNNNQIRNEFDIIINDLIVDSNLSLDDSVGKYYAIRKKYIVKVEKGENITIQFHGILGKPFINGIKLRYL
ncbi:glycoside hydrolase family 2 TIM barrel-domain containing protein [Dysgonomonas macrotermitis]|uniref:Beta-galactosidase n=1 Tax=Dysgonomonas macrotermitis TaxID=1346286 RepID=A0A1M4XD01_9BACT|nr:glycoside hydrolase family 2 TIM barrel-domain containing protein [Dysgonomonas macrotermitis]SHE91290.1 beta-galactosidase [Dysgonomonas macrotermitis]